MKSIKTLVADIEALFKDGAAKLDEAHCHELGVTLGNTIAARLSAERETGKLRLSSIGQPCARKLWYEINSPESGEPLTPSTRLKFLFGDILEGLLIFLAKAAGHTVSDEQKTVSVREVPGHLDCKIDGEVVDVKSASTYSFRKFQDHQLEQNDPFGYITQLGSYASAEDQAGGHFLVIDKALGNLTLDSYPRASAGVLALIEQRKVVAASPDAPERGFHDEPEGKSGNRKLCLECSYCAFKKPCWPGLKLARYAGKPTFLTKIVKIPNVEVRDV